MRPPHKGEAKGEKGKWRKGKGDREGEGKGKGGEGASNPSKCHASTTCGRMPSEALGASNTSKMHSATHLLTCAFGGSRSQTPPKCILEYVAECFLRLMGPQTLPKCILPRFYNGRVRGAGREGAGEGEGKRRAKGKRKEMGRRGERERKGGELRWRGEIMALENWAIIDLHHGFVIWGRNWPGHIKLGFGFCLRGEGCLPASLRS